MIAAVITTALIIILILTGFLYITNRYGYWEKRGIVYARPSLLLGNLGFFMRKSFWDFFCELNVRYPKDYVGTYFGWKPVLVVQSPGLARKILVEDAEYFQNRYASSGTDGDPVGSVSLFLHKGPQRKQIRQNMTAMFTPAKLKQTAEFMNIKGKELAEKIQRDTDKNENVNLKEIFTMYTSDTVISSVFGLQANALNGEYSSAWYVSNQMVKWNFSRGLEMLSILFFPDLAKLLRMKFFSRSATTILRKMFRQSVGDREIKDVNPRDFVGHMLNVKEIFSLNNTPEQTENLMLGQAGVFMLASSIAPAATLSFCCHELAYHPNEQEKLYAEINVAIIQNGNECLKYEELQKLKYLKAVLNETLRKHVPAPHLDRVTLKDYKLTDDLTLEKGTPVFISLPALHYNEKIFPKPTEWHPERFLECNEFDNHQYSFLPFGEGLRNCTGKRYGMLQLRIAMVHIVYNFKLEPAAPYVTRNDPKSLVKLPYNGGKVKFVPRKRTI